MLNEDDLLVVNIPPQEESIIKVIGVGGGGSNAVNHMCRQGIRGVEFVVCNTDIQALRISPVKNRIQIGKELTEGRGAGSLPERGKQSAIESLDYIKTILERNTKMVFITAGMGGGTGTGKKAPRANREPKATSADAPTHIYILASAVTGGKRPPVIFILIFQRRRIWL